MARLGGASSQRIRDAIKWERRRRTEHIKALGVLGPLVRFRILEQSTHDGGRPDFQQIFANRVGENALHVGSKLPCPWVYILVRVHTALGGERRGKCLGTHPCFE